MLKLKHPYHCLFGIHLPPPMTPFLFFIFQVWRGANRSLYRFGYSCKWHCQYAVWLSPTSVPVPARGQGHFSVAGDCGLWLMAMECVQTQTCIAWNKMTPKNFSDTNLRALFLLAAVLGFSFHLPLHGITEENCLRQCWI